MSNSSENLKIVNDIKIDTIIVKRLLAKIIVKEKTNIKTKQYNDGQMVAQIKKMIEEEVKCY